MKDELNELSKKLILKNLKVGRRTNFYTVFFFLSKLTIKAKL
jgi:hypothetical protein